MPIRSSDRIALVSTDESVRRAGQCKAAASRGSNGTPASNRDVGPGSRHVLNNVFSQGQLSGSGDDGRIDILGRNPANPADPGSRRPLTAHVPGGTVPRPAMTVLSGVRRVASSPVCPCLRPQSNDRAPSVRRGRGSRHESHFAWCGRRIDREIGPARRATVLRSAEGRAFRRSAMALVCEFVKRHHC